MILAAILGILIGTMATVIVGLAFGIVRGCPFCRGLLHLDDE